MINNTNMLTALKENEKVLVCSDASSKKLLNELVRHAPERLRQKPVPFFTIEDFVELVDCSNDNLDAVAAVLIYMQIYLNERFEGPKTYDVMLLPAQSQQVVRCLVSLDFELSMKS